MKHLCYLVFTLVLCLSCSISCSERPYNSPYPPSWLSENTLFRSFTEQPKHLDPARSYSSNEVVFIGQIYEPPLQYHYLSRPYKLIPLSASVMPKVSYRDNEGHLLAEDAPNEKIAESVYTIRISPNIFYQNHPAFAKDGDGNLLYHDIDEAKLRGVSTLYDFDRVDTRELTAEDYVYQIKRLANPFVQSPIADFMSEYIIGFKKFSSTLRANFSNKSITDANKFTDLRNLDLSGVKVLDRYTYEIRVRGKYPQFLYWLAMPFFAPIPYEADCFYSQASLRKLNISLDTYPIGTGPYYLAVNDPNRLMELRRNPNFHGETFSRMEKEDSVRLDLNIDLSGNLPFVDRVVYSMEKEAIPTWSKFLQGYYDISGIGSDTFDQVIKFSETGEVGLTEEMEAKGIRLITSVTASIMYIGFNMLDPIIGGNGENARKLRLAIAIALNTEEFISIFLNERGIAAQGPLPPEIFGYRIGAEGIDPYVYSWDGHKPIRKIIDIAKKLLAEAGYTGGIDSTTGAPLVLYFDTVTSGAESKSELDWLIRQFRALGIQLIIRATDYNTFQDKMIKGAEQIYRWGWNADYPDPENFLFLLYGKNGKVLHGGENASNYNNPEYDRLFEEMRNLENGERRQVLIDRMLEILRHDAPWIWGYYPKSYALVHKWQLNNKPNLMANNTLKYLKVDPTLRAKLVVEWNYAKFLPF